MLKSIYDLKPHPENEKIYGENESVTDLKEKIRQSGVVTEIVITPNGVILSVCAK